MDKHLRSTLPVPTEITVNILQQLERTDCWSFALSSCQNYRVAREYVLFTKLKIGWWPKHSVRHQEYLDCFDRTRDSDYRLKEDVRDIELLGIGSNIRNLSVGVAEAGIFRHTYDEDYDTRPLWPKRFMMAFDSKGSEDTLRRLFSLTPNLTSATVYGCHATYITTIAMMVSLCPRLEYLFLTWDWVHQFPETAPFDFRARFQKLRKLHIEVNLDRIPLDSRYSLGWIVEPLVRASVSPFLRDLKVEICTPRMEKQGVDWANLSSGLQLKTLSYSATIDRPVLDILSNMTDVCNGLEELIIDCPSCGGNATDFDELVPWFAELQMCKKMELGFKVDVPGFVGKEAFTQIYAIRKSFLRRLASVMPKLEHVLWLESEDDEDELLYGVQMQVTRGSIGDTYPSRVGFKRVPTLQRGDPEYNEEIHLQITNTEFDFSD